MSSLSLETFVDSSVLLDLFTEDPRWLSWSQEQLTQAAQRGAIVLNAIVLAEIAPRFPRIETLRSALPSMAVIEEIPTAAAFLAGHAHADYRRAGGTREAVLPDFLVASQVPGELAGCSPRWGGMLCGDHLLGALGRGLCGCGAQLAA